MKEYNYSTPELRILYKQHSRALREAVEAAIWSKPYQLPSFPEECRGMRCGAKTRKGTPCKLNSLYANGRCKFHGGMSTGPKTKEGKARSASNWRFKKLIV